MRTDRFIKILATVFLIVFFILAISSAIFESTTVDEIAHITAGYSYLTKKDMRLNPEHPPLLKDISALFLLPLHLKFPHDSKAWLEEINGQWELGFDFFYKSGNNPDQILFWARLGPMILAVLLGIFIFKFTKEFFNTKVALLALFLFLFSPTVLAHSRYATTDIAATFGFFTATFYFLRFLKNPNKKNLAIAGIFFGIAQLFKFSLILLIPFFAIISIIWIFTKNFQGSTLKNMGLIFLIFAIGYLFVVFPVYQFHIWNYPARPQSAEEKKLILSAKSCDEINKSAIIASQFRDTACQLKTYKGATFVKNAIIWTSNKPILRAFSQYASGFLMASKRVSAGSLNYFFGTVSYGSHALYFPVAFFVKEPIALHILILIAIYSSLRSRTDIKEHLTEFVLFLFVVFYLLISISGNLNIGIRHILPVYPFIFILISIAIFRKLESMPNFEFISNFSTFKKIFYFYFNKFLMYAIVFILLIWYATSSISIFPNFLTYFNEMAGGPANGYKYLSDSNLDWGQSLKQLATFVEENNIEKIHLDYFGNGYPEYYLKEKYIPWSSKNGAPHGWFAVSAYYLDMATGAPSGSFKRTDEDSYLWLRDKTPQIKIDNSIFVYYFE